MKHTDKPTNKNIFFEDGEWKYASPHMRKLGMQQTLASHVKKNKTRMFVNGKYISKSHPLHKPGNYKTFEDAAFSSLSRYESSKEGEVYIITNPAWKGWLKIGMAVDAEDRCNGYQTSSPKRDYKLMFKRFFDDRRNAERKAHQLINKKAKGRNGEWFKIAIPTARKMIESL